MHLLSLAAGLLLTTTAHAPRTDPTALMRDTLARAGDRGVTALDLVQRIEWMPWPGKQGALSDSAKVRAVQSLAAEKLLAQEARRRHVGDTGPIAAMESGLRRALARDALFRDVVATIPAPAPATVDRIVHQRWPRAPASQFPALRRTVADSLRALEGRERAAGFFQQLLAGRRVTADSLTFMAFGDSLRAVMLAHGGARNADSAYVLPGGAPDALRSRLAPRLGQPLARMSDGPYALGDALEDLRYYPFVFHSLARGPFLRELSQHLRVMIENEVAAREALRRGLDRRADVRHDLEMWSDAVRGRALLERVAAQVGPDDDAVRELRRADPSLTLNQAVQIRREQEVARFVASLATHARVEFNYAAARQVEIASYNMLVRRFLGFGGAMTAAPSLVPQWDWVEAWRAARRTLP